MLDKFKGKKTKKARVAVEEEHLLSFINVCDDNIIFDTGVSNCMQVDIQEAYLSATTVPMNYGFGDVTDKDDILDLEAPTECEDKEKVSELKTNCAREAQLSNKRHEDHDDDVEPPMNFNENNEVELDYDFHNDAAFVQVELGLEDKDVEEMEDLSQISPTLQALNSPHMWIGDTAVTRHSKKYKQGGINSRPSTSRTRGIYL